MRPVVHGQVGTAIQRCLELVSLSERIGGGRSDTRCRDGRCFAGGTSSSFRGGLYVALSQSQLAVIPWITLPSHVRFAHRALCVVFCPSKPLARCWRRAAISPSVDARRGRPPSPRVRQTGITDYRLRLGRPTAVEKPSMPSKAKSVATASRDAGTVQGQDAGMPLGFRRTPVSTPGRSPSSTTLRARRGGFDCAVPCSGHDAHLLAICSRANGDMSCSAVWRAIDTPCLLVRNSLHAKPSG